MIDQFITPEILIAFVNYLSVVFTDCDTQNDFRTHAPVLLRPAFEAIGALLVPILDGLKVCK